jgi:hypothetical protein
MLIRVGKDLGLVEYAPGPASERVAQLINRNLRSALVNADPTKIEALPKKILQRLMVLSKLFCWILKGRPRVLRCPS